MPKVTDIQPQKFNPDRYSIFVDDEFSFALSANELLAQGLRAGQELSDEGLATVKHSAGQAKAYDQAVNLIGLRKRSEQEVRNYLKRKDYEAETIDRTIVRLVNSALLDDAGFARSWVRDRQNLKPRSRRVLLAELRQKGVGRQLAEEVVAEVGDEAEIAAIKKLATKKLTQHNEQSQRKVFSYLVRQGFDYDLIKRALETD